MRRGVFTFIASLLLLVPISAMAQGRPGQPSRPAAPPAAGASEPQAEIKLDESTALKADAVESRVSAVLANLALLQRQWQDLQQEGGRLVEERKKLIEDAGRKANVEVKDTSEWVFDSKGNRYVHGRRAQGSTPASR